MGKKNQSKKYPPPQKKNPTYRIKTNKQTTPPTHTEQPTYHHQIKARFKPVPSLWKA